MNSKMASKENLSHSLEKNFEKIKQCENNIVLFGSVGSGKTTLINKLCGVNFLADDKGFSCTRDVQFATTITNSNTIIDFPGLNAAVDILKHIKIQKSTLSLIPFKMVCFVVKFTARYDDLVKSVTQMIKIFRNYMENILIVVTHCDCKEVTITVQAEIEHIFKSKFKINNVMFTGLSTKEDWLSDQMNKFKSKMKNIEETIIETRKFYQNIDPDADFDLDVIDDREKFINKFTTTLSLFKEEFNQAKDKELKRSLYFALRDYKNNLIEEYSAIIKDKKIDQSAIITELIMFQNQIFNDFNSFRKMAQTSLEIQSTNYKGEFNKYKKCIKCGRIWFRIYGCDSILCGKRSTLIDKLWGNFTDYVIKFFGSKLSIVKTEGKNDLKIQEKEFFGLSEEEKEMNKLRDNNEHKFISPEGCGYSMRWDDMEDVTDDVLRMLKEIPISDYDSKVVELGEKFEKSSQL